MQIGDLVKLRIDSWHPSPSPQFLPTGAVNETIVKAGTIGIITGVRGAYTPPRIMVMISRFGIETEYSSIKWELANE